MPEQDVSCDGEASKKDSNKLVQCKLGRFSKPSVSFDRQPRRKVGHWQLPIQFMAQHGAAAFRRGRLCIRNSLLMSSTTFKR